MKTDKTITEHTILTKEQRVTYYLELSKEEAIYLLLLTGANSSAQLTELLDKNTVPLPAEDIKQTRRWAAGKEDKDAGTIAVYFGLHDLLTKGETK